jgi:hypothetical protein
LPSAMWPWVTVGRSQPFLVLITFIRCAQGPTKPKTAHREDDDWNDLWLSYQDEDDARSDHADNWDDHVTDPHSHDGVAHSADSPF